MSEAIRVFHFAHTDTSIFALTGGGVGNIQRRVGYFRWALSIPGQEIRAGEGKTFDKAKEAMEMCNDAGQAHADAVPND